MKDKQLCHFSGCVNEVRSFTPKNDSAHDNLDCGCGARVCLVHWSFALEMCEMCASGSRRLSAFETPDGGF
jgi:hypothetical protein